jgi:hypothetical protein
MASRRLARSCLPALAAVLFAGAHVSSDEPGTLLASRSDRDVEWRELTVLPPVVELRGAGESHAIVVLASSSSGRWVDVTDRASIDVVATAVAEVGGAAGSTAPLLVARASGETLGQARFAGLGAEFRVRVRDAGETRTPTFRDEVIGVLTRHGCNQGKCHGKVAGQNGFRLSLRGYAPELDLVAIARENGGRRINIAFPERSLLLEKARGESSHGGGRLFEADDRAARVLRDWIARGAPPSNEDDPVLESVEVLPSGLELGVGDRARLIVRGRYSNGDVRDITWRSTFFSNDASVVEVDPLGRVGALRPGETPVRVHAGEHVEVVIVTVPRGTPIVASSFPGPRTFIDDHVFTKLARLGIPASPLADDSAFVRRAFLDTIGTLPSIEEVEAYVADTRPEKRDRLVDLLLERPEFIECQTLFIADLLQNRKERDHDVRGTKGVRAFHAWIREQVAARRSWRSIASAVLLAAGDSSSHPEIGYWVVTVGEANRAEESEVAASIAQSFLGTRIGCAKCHNHPLERYTQDDYFRFAAFFSRVSFDRKNPAEGRTELYPYDREERERRGNIARTEKTLASERSVLEHLLSTGASASAATAAGSEPPTLDLAAARAKIDELEKQLASQKQELVRHRERPIGVVQPRTGAFLTPGPLDRSLIELRAGEDPRSSFDAWLANGGSELFAGSMINRLWRHFFGAGLVEPVDDLRSSNPPSHPELWRELVAEFVKSDYDIRTIVRTILRSNAYALSSSTLAGNESDTRLFSHYLARRLPAEILLDATSDVLGVPDRFSGYPVGIRAIQLPDPGVASYFLGLFGRPERVTACACERQGDVTLPQLLHLQNGDEIRRKIRAPEGRVAAWLVRYSHHENDVKLIDTLWLTALARRPTSAEREALGRIIDESRALGEAREELVYDLVWGLLNSKEFSFQH